MWKFLYKWCRMVLIKCIGGYNIMRFGVCTGIDNAERLKYAVQAGMDYVECGFGFLATSTDEEFENAKNNLKEANIKCEAANCFIPSQFPIADSSCDRKALAEYVEKGMKRGTEIGLKIVVLGSGGARKVPENVTFKDGFKNISSILSDIISPIAEKYDITVVIEPLRYKECNIFNTVKEGVMLAASTGKDNIWGLADIFHMVESGDTCNDIRDLKNNIKHAHISYPIGDETNKRTYPKDINEFDYKGFIDALTFAGCERCSIEAGCTDFNNEVLISGKVLDQLR